MGQQLRKVALCRFFESNQCRKGTSCPFAHGEAELQTRPNLSKTTICRNWMKRCCKLDAAECNFAHGERDLRTVDKCNSVVPKLDKCNSVMPNCSLETSCDSSEKERDA